MRLKTVRLRPERDAGTGLRAIATLIIEARVELIMETDIRIAGIRVCESVGGMWIEFPDDVKCLTDQLRDYFTGETIDAYRQWLERRAERNGDLPSLAA